MFLANLTKNQKSVDHILPWQYKVLCPFLDAVNISIMLIRLSILSLFCRLAICTDLFSSLTKILLLHLLVGVTELCSDTGIVLRILQILLIRMVIHCLLVFSLESRRLRIFLSI